MTRMYWSRFRFTLAVALILTLSTTLVAPPVLAAAPGTNGPVVESDATAWTLSWVLPPWLDAFLGSLGIGRVSASAGGDITVGGVAQDPEREDSTRAELRLLPTDVEETAPERSDPTP